MANKMTFRVMREMEGDRFYRAGETREMLPADAAHLLQLGALAEIDGKVESTPLNKAEPAPRRKRTTAAD
ncbi:hypothetical protein [Arenibaculum pallidiluteum]|uniref:hypothetical protein n=1 Tax=Arenibaculum pallidiluteum TaxID=2812559 RepID=UPI001A972DAF|nr:hypothetical protein [Arenibaculum pallidiluteum]